MNRIIIGRPYLEKNKLCCDIRTKEMYNMWFEVENEYVEYLCKERADAFLVAILPYAIKYELDIKINAKISSKLYYQLTTCFIPLICEYLKKRIIKIDTQLDNTSINNIGAVGTGVSMGIDSFYSILKNSNLQTREFNVTHLTFFNAGASGKFGGEKARDLYNTRKEKAREFALENGFKFVCVDSNINEFLMMSHIATHTYRSIACVFALQKLFSTYYYASLGEKFDEIRFSDDVATYDILLLQCLSNENMQLYSDGVGVTRMGKVKMIVNYPITYRWLNVCINEDKNCGHCAKCIRTQLALESVGKLEKYKNVFDLDQYKKNRNKFLAFMIEQKKSSDYFKEIYNEYKNNHIKMPIISYIIAIKNICKSNIKTFLKEIIPKKLINKIKGRNERDIIDEWW